MTYQTQSTSRPVATRYWTAAAFGGAMLTTVYPARALENAVKPDLSHRSTQDNRARPPSRPASIDDIDAAFDEIDLTPSQEADLLVQRAARSARPTVSLLRAVIQ